MEAQQIAAPRLNAMQATLVLIGLLLLAAWGGWVLLSSPDVGRAAVAKPAELANLAEAMTEYESLVKALNPNYNFVTVKVVKTKGGDALYAYHDFFSEYTFSAGADGPAVSAFVNQHRAKLREWGIVRVGVMGTGSYATGTWFEVK